MNWVEARAIRPLAGGDRQLDLSIGLFADAILGIGGNVADRARRQGPPPAKARFMSEGSSLPAGE